MATFVLIPGAGGHAAYWNRLIPELETRGHRAVAVDIEEDDPSMDLDGFAASCGSCNGRLRGRHRRRPVTRWVHRADDPQAGRMIVLLNAMIPRSGESPNEWWGNTGSGSARREADLAAGM